MGILCNIFFSHSGFLYCPLSVHVPSRADGSASVNTQAEAPRGIFTTAADKEVRMGEVQLRSGVTCSWKVGWEQGRGGHLRVPSRGWPRPLL